jgi:pyruvate/2-oxoglutarate dehydrogenase complex dihydrolipoamide dehydrogenase (E3) component
MHRNAHEEKLWDCIVIGAGIEGSNAARYSAKLGKDTLCLEQVNYILCLCILKRSFTTIKT